MTCLRSDVCRCNPYSTCDLPRTCVCPPQNFARHLRQKSHLLRADFWVSKMTPEMGVKIWHKIFKAPFPASLTPIFGGQKTDPKMGSLSWAFCCLERTQASSAGDRPGCGCVAMRATKRSWRSFIRNRFPQQFHTSGGLV